jgi:hypothetical protein
MIASADVRYPMPNPNQHPLTGTFARDIITDLLHEARPVFLDLADRADLREIARDWEPRIDIHAARSEDRPADAMLIRPDAYIAWAATVGEPVDSAAPALRDALTGWFGALSRRR